MSDQAEAFLSSNTLAFTLVLATGLTWEPTQVLTQQFRRLTLVIGFSQGTKTPGTIRMRLDCPKVSKPLGPSKRHRDVPEYQNFWDNSIVNRGWVRPAMATSGLDLWSTVAAHTCWNCGSFFPYKT